MIAEGKKQIVLDEIRRHYDGLSQPYYLAGLGQFFRSEGIEIPSGKRFKDFLSESFSDSLVIIQDPDVPAKIAIALPQNSKEVQEQLFGRFLPTSGRPPIEVNRLPFSLIAAFCQVPNSGLRVFYRAIRPSRYVIGSIAPDNSFVEIGANFRKPLPEGISLHELSAEVKQDIYRRISEWAAFQDFDLEAIYLNEKGRTTSQKDTRADRSSNALRRLIEAQEPEIRKKISVPGDIALALMALE